MQTVVIVLFSMPEFFNYKEDLGFRVWELELTKYDLRGTIYEVGFGIWYLDFFYTGSFA